jgi:hypothetical protein
MPSERTASRGHGSSNRASSPAAAKDEAQDQSRGGRDDAQPQSIQCERGGQRSDEHVALHGIQDQGDQRQDQEHRHDHAAGTNDQVRADDIPAQMPLFQRRASKVTVAGPAVMHEA